MAAQGAATKSQGPKKKGTTLPLTSFLKPEVSDWADDDPDGDALPALPTAPGGGSPAPVSHSAGQPSPGADLSRLPTRPPFKIYVGNLDYNVTAQELGEYFFQTFKVVDVLLLKHEDTGNVKGAFVEFEDVEDLQGALSHNGKMFMDRPMRIDVASDRPNRGYQRQGNFDDRGPHSSRGGFGAGFGDRRGGFGDRPDFQERGGHYGGFADRGFPERRGGLEAGFPGEQRPRDRGGFSNAAREDMDAPRWGHRRPSNEAPQRQPAAPAPASEPSAPPTERKRLVLAPRSKSTENDGATDLTSAADQAKKSSPFGEARPVDASARLRELEEKIAKQKAEDAAARARAAEKSAPTPAAGPSDGGAQPQALVSRNPAAAPPERGPAASSPPPGRGPVPREAANGQFGAPASLEGGRGEHGPGYGRGRRGRGREGRGRHGGDFAWGRGPPAHTTGPSQRPGPPPDPSSFREAADRRSRGRTRAVETHTPASTAPQAQQGAQSGEAEVSKVTNMFDMLGAAED